MTKGTRKTTQRKLSVDDPLTKEEQLNPTTEEPKRQRGRPKRNVAVNPTEGGSSKVTTAQENVQPEVLPTEKEKKPVGTRKKLVKSEESKIHKDNKQQKKNNTKKTVEQNVRAASGKSGTVKAAHPRHHGTKKTVNPMSSEQQEKFEKEQLEKEKQLLEQHKKDREQRYEKWSKQHENKGIVNNEGGKLTKELSEEKQKNKPTVLQPGQESEKVSSSTS